MAGVYKAPHESGQIVAIKVLPASKAKRPGALARFKREAKLLTQLDHPNVVRAFQVGEADGKHYLVLEYLDGETLDEVLEKRKRCRRSRPSGSSIRRCSGCSTSTNGG